MGIFVIATRAGTVSGSYGGIAGGVIALECWCAYFLPVGILAFSHFRSGK